MRGLSHCAAEAQSALLGQWPSGEAAERILRFCMNEHPHKQHFYKVDDLFLSELANL